MKHILLFLLIPSICFGITLNGVTVNGAKIIAYSPVIMPLGNSITLGGGDETGQGGYRGKLQRLLNPWANNWVGTQTTNNISPLKKYHMGFSGKNTSLVYDEFDAVDSLNTWFSTRNIKNIIIHMNGTLETAGNEATMDTAVTLMGAWLDNATAFDIANGTVTNIIFCNVSPSANNARDVKVVYINGELETMFSSNTNPNKYWVDLYTPLKTCWGTDGNTAECNADDTHPTSAGYEIMTNIIYSKMVEVGIDP